MESKLKFCYSIEKGTLLKYYIWVLKKVEQFCKNQNLK